MANNNVYHNSANIASFSLTDPDPEPDDISVFLRHILLPSSSSSSSNFMALKGNEMQYSSPLPHLIPNNNQQGDLSSMMNSSAGGIFSSSYGAYNGATNVSSSCLYGLNERTTKTASIGANVAYSVPLDTDASNLKRNTREACLLRYQFGAVNETNLDCDQISRE